ncbi:MAG: tetratricopeptide repeat protein [Bacteroidetes bacterium]|nr:tetratricopeptide repeat protein [Bacteroidota bacterium]
MNAQNDQIDSLLKVLQTQEESDTNKVITLYKLCAKYINSDTKKAIEYGNKAKDLGEKLNFKRGVASALNNLGIVYENEGDYEKAADCYLRSIRIKEETKNMHGLAATYSNLGEVFDVENNYEKASYYYNKSLQIAISIKDTQSIMNCYLNTGVIESEKNNDENAVTYFQKCLHLAFLAGDSSSLADAYSNIGVVRQDQNILDSAEYYYALATIVRQRTGDQMGLMNSYNNLGSVNVTRKNYREGERWYKMSISIQDKIPSLEGLQSSYHGLATLYDSLRDFQNAKTYYLKYMTVHDSLYSMRSVKEVNAMELKYEEEKKEKEDEAKARENKIKSDAEAREQRNLMYFLIILILVASGFSFFLFNRFRFIRRQKGVIETKNKEIIDSINYAKRLQEAILPPAKMVDEIFPQNFIFYRPKDIVAGDFYWMMENGNDLFVAVADCTGHGVPGAMVSFVCSNALDRAVKEFELKDPGKILDKVTELLLDTFRKSEQEVKDGMDISLCHLNRDNMNISFSGAHNSLWIVRSGNLISLDADNQPVGKYDHAKPFTTHHFTLEKNDVLYFGTDGYADQFGGDKARLADKNKSGSFGQGKKFKTANIRNLLVANAGRPMKEQYDVLEKTFDRWKGNLEQVDDVCVMGIRI